MPRLSNEESRKIEKLFARYEHYLLRIAERYVGKTSCAEDIVIETFIKIIPHLGKLNLEDGHKARNYLVTVVENLTLDELRKKKILPLKEEFLGEFWLDEELDEAENKELVIQAMKKLKVQDEQILRLKYLQELSNPEIAKLLSIKEPTVRKRLERARKRLREIVESLT